MNDTPQSLERRRTLWPWLVLGAFVLAILAVRLFAATMSVRELPVITTVPAFELVDQTGQAFGSHELSGRVWIASFIYTTCPGPCPRVVQRVSETQSRLGNEPDLVFVSISVDPEADTPEVLAAFGTTRGIQPTTWRLLTGRVDAVIRLVREGFLLAVAKADHVDAELIKSEGPIVHSTRLVLVDRQMRVRGTYESTDPAAVDQLVEETRQLLRKSS